MANRSNFQGATLYFSATTLAASVLIGGSALNIAEWLGLLQESVDLESAPQRAAELAATGSSIKDSLPPAIADKLPESTDAVLDQAKDVIMGYGWTLGSVFAMVWSKIQTIALGAVTFVSGICVRDSVVAGPFVDGETALAAMMLQVVSLSIAGVGLLSQGLNAMGGSKAKKGSTTAKFKPKSYA